MFSNIDTGRKVYLGFIISMIFFIVALALISFSPGMQSKIAKIIIIATLAILEGILAIFFKKNIVNNLSQNVSSLREGVGATVSAISQLTNTTQQLSQNINEQSASLEETSGSLTEINAMTIANFEHTQKANELAFQAKQSAENSNVAITEMLGAMCAINDSSTKISHISKTIEDIAFQTNILALNAAVEAARAGEYGRGFAVVADEVRNLAKHSATAAQDTAQLIQENLNKTAAGTDIASKAVDAISAIIDNIDKIAVVISEITRASKEQTENITQITSAVSQMDKATQQNAASTEESASASEELSSQMSVLLSQLRDLHRLIAGKDISSQYDHLSKAFAKEESRHALRHMETEGSSEQDIKLS